MENNWTKIFTSEDPIKAEIIKQSLIENDIPAVILNQQDSSYKVFGLNNVMVQKENVDKALAHLETNYSNED
ncbi:MAG: hypothetical protein EOO88_10010 [Pedobacter sp.]|nr:MAG: hypothetical protein EOO88_10010 [Pedobacter sp.]